MDHFVQFLHDTKKASASIDFTKTPVHLVMGNESCDLDSMICALALAYYHHRTDVTDSNKIVLPILNIPTNEFALRTENCYILKPLGINEDHLIFRDSFNFEEIVRYGLLSVSIVDHHVLRDEDRFLERSVIEVYDHRPRDPNCGWDANLTDVVIEEVASCATLISHKLLRDQIITKTLAELLYDVIIFDSIAFSLEAQKVRELDTVVSEELKRQFGLCCKPQERFEELWRAHNDVRHLTTKQLLYKDVKFLDGLPIPGLPMLVWEYLQLTDVRNELISFCEEVNATNLLLMGLKVVNDEVFRDLAIFSRSDGEMRDLLVEHLKANRDLDLTERKVDVPDVVYFEQNNVKMSRKQILPIIKSIKRYRLFIYFPKDITFIVSCSKLFLKVK